MEMKDFIKKYVFEDYMDHLNQLSDDEREFFKQDTLEVFEEIMENWADAIDISYVDCFGKIRNEETRRAKEIVKVLKDKNEWKSFINDIYEIYLNRSKALLNKVA